MGVSCKTRNHPTTSQSSHKPAKPATNQPVQSQTNQMPGKPPKNQAILNKKSALYVTNSFSDNENHVLNLQPLYASTLMFSSKDQGQIGIEGKRREII